jgi:adenosine/AMP kinase
LTPISDESAFHDRTDPGKRRVPRWRRLANPPARARSTFSPGGASFHIEEAAVELLSVRIEKPDDVNVIVGQSHFIKTVEDLHEALAGSTPQLRFGIAFCESSGPRLLRRSGNDEELVALAVRNAQAIGAGHSFVVVLRQGFPMNVLNALKVVPELCTLFCATANPVEIVVARTEAGRGILGVIDGGTPLGVESDADVEDRKKLLRRFGYKL